MMADNLDTPNIEDPYGLPRVVRTTEVNGVHTPHVLGEMMVSGINVSTINPVPAEDGNLILLLDEIRQLLTGESDDSERPDWVDLRTRIINAVGRDGALRNSDAPALVSGASSIANGVLVTIDTTGYNSVSLQLRGTWAGTITFTASNDFQTWYAVSGWPATAAAAPVSTSTAVGLWLFPAVGRWFRAYISAYTSGTAIADAYLRTQALPLPSTPTVAVSGTAATNVSQVGGVALVAPGAAAASNPVPVSGVDLQNMTRRLLTDNIGSIITGDNVNEQKSLATLQSILMELQKCTYLLASLPEAIKNGDDIGSMLSLSNEIFIT